MAEFSTFLDEKKKKISEGVVLKVLEEFDVPPAEEKVSPTSASPSRLSPLPLVRSGPGCLSWWRCAPAPASPAPEKLETPGSRGRSKPTRWHVRRKAGHGDQPRSPAVAATGWLCAAGGERWAAPAFLLELVASGRLGKKLWCLSLSPPSLPQEALGLQSMVA